MGTRLLAGLASLVLFAVVVLFAALAIDPHLFGYRTETMLKGSMSPGIRPGDVILTVAEPVGKVRTGQILSFRIPIADHRVVSHRVVGVEKAADGAVSIRTKGDANSQPDPWLARLDGQQAWQVRAVVPSVGRMISTLRSSPLAMGLLRLGLVLFAVDLLFQIWRPGKRTQS